MIFEYFTFHNFSDSVKVSTAVFFFLVLVSGTKYDLLPYQSVPDFIRASSIYLFIKYFAIIILLRILSQTEFPFKAIDDLVSSVRDRFTRNEPEYDGFTLIIAHYTKTTLPEADLCNYMDDNDVFSGKKIVQSEPSKTITSQNLMEQVLTQQRPAFIRYKSTNQYFLMYLLKLTQFLMFRFHFHPCSAAYLDILNRPSDYQFQPEADRNKSPFELLFSCLERGLALTQDQYKRSGLGEPALDRDLALLRYFLTRTFEFHRLSWTDSHLDLTSSARRAWSKARLYYAKVREVSLDLEAELPTPWLRRAIEALFKTSGHTIVSRYAKPKTTKVYAIFRDLDYRHSDLHRA